ncbi:hypothetical protein WJX73_001462 [Symbiochloris irregularis]|uniref:Plastid lipid-associated protein/fibrillin conserved domain-containing protein n=1 Tax=Symbiochloris irregularis TaxID=706552 RepID=A0AAW1PLS7_9CHLO
MPCLSCLGHARGLVSYSKVSSSVQTRTLQQLRRLPRAKRLVCAAATAAPSGEDEEAKRRLADQVAKLAADFAEKDADLAQEVKGGRSTGDQQAKDALAQDIEQLSSIEQAKQALALQIVGTDRGGTVNSAQRGQVAEAQAALEALSPGIEYDELEGLWEVIYTTAPDVAPLIGAGSNAQITSVLAPFRTGRIFQRFSSVAVGTVDNIIQLTIPFLLQPEGGITLRVAAEWQPRSAPEQQSSAKRIKLRFRSAGVDKVRISSLTESLLAPALLPRGWLQHRILLALEEFQFRIPLRSPEGSSRSIQSNAGNEFLLTFLDADMLVGRQSFSGGSIIFRKASDTQTL